MKETTDARCKCDRCSIEERSYVMQHNCNNCNDNFTARHRFGDKARSDCPLCGASWYRTNATKRLETTP